MTTQKAPSSENQEKSESQRSAEDRLRYRSRADRLAAGNALRDRVPRQSHERWSSSHAKSRDPIEILNQSNEGRVQELVPLRFGRMLRSPFTFFRGSAGLMAHDLAKLPSTQVHVQACGDCHLVNFGLFATPERKLVFDINDFDETLPAPWEWDVKRLAASFVVAARDNQISDAKARDIATACVRSYREHLREYSRMSPLEVWYARMDVDYLIETAPDAAARKTTRSVCQGGDADASSTICSRRFRRRSPAVLAWWTSRRCSSTSRIQAWRNAFARLCSSIASRCPTNGACSSIAIAWKTSR